MAGVGARARKPGFFVVGELIRPLLPAGMAKFWLLSQVTSTLGRFWSGEGSSQRGGWRSGRARSCRVGVAQHLDGVTDGEVGAEFGEVGAELGEATDVAGGENGGAGGQDSLGFLLAQRGGDDGLVQVVGAGTAAADVRVRQFQDLDAGDGAQ